MTDISNEIEKTNQTEGFSADEYNYVARNAQLEAINLLDSQFKINPECLADQENWKLSYGRQILSCQFSEEDGNVAGIFQYNVTAKLGRKKAAHFVAEYVVFYGVPGDVTDTSALGFCHNIGSFAAYPYFRALFAHMASEAGINFPPLPAIASTAHIQKKEGS